MLVDRRLRYGEVIGHIGIAASVAKHCVKHPPHCRSKLPGGNTVDSLYPLLAGISLLHAGIERLVSLIGYPAGMARGHVHLAQTVGKLMAHGYSKICPGLLGENIETRIEPHHDIVHAVERILLVEKHSIGHLIEPREMTVVDLFEAFVPIHYPFLRITCLIYGFIFDFITSQPLFFTFLMKKLPLAV